MMSLNFGKRHHGRGRHFKLFSDELPRIEFDKASLEEYEHSVHERRKTRGGRRRTIRDVNNDRLSLPSLGTPEWDMLSDRDHFRPTSMQSPPFNPLNPNFAKIHEKIKRRHTVKETNIHAGYSNPKDTTKSDNDREQEEAKREINESSEEKIKQSGANSSKPSNKITRQSSERNTNDSSVVTGKPPIPKQQRSVFKDLLEASAKANTRMNRIRDGLRFDKTEKRNKHYDSHSKGDKESNMDFVDARVPEVLSIVSANNKPSILKQGARVREIKRAHATGETYLKPRLVHQDDYPLLRNNQTTTKESGNEVRVSIYSETPLNRVNDMIFVPTASTTTRVKPKRVNFHETVIREETEVSESDLNDRRVKDKDPVLPKLRVGNGFGESGLNSSKQQQTNEWVFSKLNIPKANTLTPIRNSCSEKVKPLQDRKERNEFLDRMQQSPFPRHDPHNNPSWKEMRSPLSPEKTQDFYGVVAPVNTPVDYVTTTRNTVTLTHTGSPSTVRGPVVTVTEATNEPMSKMSDADSFADMSAFYDDDDLDVDITDLPEEIDRSLLGEDLIKAYRLWDRKRKAFPAGLRKIEAPVDRSKKPSHQEQSMFDKRYGNVKTYKIRNGNRDIKQTVPNVSGKGSRKAVLVDWT